MTSRIARALGDTSIGGRIWALVTTVLIVAMTGWASTAGHREAVEVHHDSPGTVETVPGSHESWVTLTAAGAEKIGLEVTRVERARHPRGRLRIAYAALIHDADGITWVYTSPDDEPLRFRRQPVEVAAVTGDRAILAAGPPVGTAVVGFGSAELYGTEFEVGH